MSIKVSGVTVVDNNQNFNIGVLTATSLDVPPQAITFSPTDGSSDVALNSNIVITYDVSVAAGSGNITLRDGSASGTTIETIDVTSGSVSISGGAVTINPSDFPTGKDIYVVVDEGAITHSLFGSSAASINTYNFTTGPITTSSFSPSDGATDQSVSTNIVITFSENITKGSGNITIRSGSASGSALQTIDVTSGAVSVSGTQATINPSSDLAFETDQYIVVDAGCFRNADGDVASGNAIINTYNFTTETNVPPLGEAHEGGYLVCCSSGNLWIVAPSTTQVRRNWHCRCHAATCANANAACGDWFIPTCGQLQNPGHQCKTHWDSYNNYCYWTDTSYPGYPTSAFFVRMSDGHTSGSAKAPLPWNNNFFARAFRCVSY